VQVYALLIQIKKRCGVLSKLHSRVNEGVAIMAAPAAREHQAIYICEMMERLGLDPGGGEVPRLGLSYATALRRCQACPSKPACRDWLDSLPASAAFAPNFCPNADIFFELQVDQPSIRTLGSKKPG
jgi:hypothetical protein